MAALNAALSESCLSFAMAEDSNIVMVGVLVVMVIVVKGLVMAIAIKTETAFEITGSGKNMHRANSLLTDVGAPRVWPELLAIDWACFLVRFSGGAIRSPGAITIRLLPLLEVYCPSFNCSGQGGLCTNTYPDLLGFWAWGTPLHPPAPSLGTRGGAACWEACGPMLPFLAKAWSPKGGFCFGQDRYKKKRCCCMSSQMHFWGLPVDRFIVRFFLAPGLITKRKLLF